MLKTKYSNSFMVMLHVCKKQSFCDILLLRVRVSSHFLKVLCLWQFYLFLTFLCLLWVTKSPGLLNLTIVCGFILETYVIPAGDTHEHVLCLEKICLYMLEKSISLTFSAQKIPKHVIFSYLIEQTFSCTKHRKCPKIWDFIHSHFTTQKFWKISAAKHEHHVGFLFCKHSLSPNRFCIELQNMIIR